MADPLVLYDVDDKVGVVTLNRPDKLNAISHELQQALTGAFARADADPRRASCCCVPRVAASAPDTTSAPRALTADDWRSDPTKAHAHLAPQLEFEMAPWLMKKPVIASVQGHVLGGGCELVMLCDLTIAADNATFGEPEVRFSAVGPAIVMPMIIGYKKARELLYFGDQIDAQTALDLGMINRIVPLAELRDGEPQLRQAPVADLARGAVCDEARGQPRRRRRRVPHRALCRARCRRSALRHRTPNTARGSARSPDRRGAGRCPVALRSVQSIVRAKQHPLVGVHPRGRPTSRCFAHSLCHPNSLAVEIREREWPSSGFPTARSCGGIGLVMQRPAPELPTNPLPLSVLTGFLGSGKTTLLSRILASPSLSDTAVIVNEFGAVGLDHLLLEVADREIVALPNGCVCCAVRQDLADTLYRLLRRRANGELPPFQRLVLETSGLAEPSPILYTLSADAFLERSLRVHAVVATIDTVSGAATLDRFPEATAQAACADWLLLTKTDLATPPPVAAAACGVEPDCQHQDAAAVAPATVLFGGGQTSGAATLRGHRRPCARHSCRRAGAAPADVATGFRHGAGRAGARARRGPAARERYCGLRRPRRRAGGDPCRSAHAVSTALVRTPGRLRSTQPAGVHRARHRK